MFKKVFHHVWAFDAEWIPDPVAGRVLYGLPADLPDGEVMLEMWRRGGATAENPMPYLKTALCRVVSVSAVVRQARRDGEVTLELQSLPQDVADPKACREPEIIGRFLGGLGKKKPQLVGYNSVSADIKTFIQRGIITGTPAPDFCDRPNKPWEGVDYFARGSDANVDLKEVVSGWGKGSPSLHEMATLSGIPGKMDVDGNAVAGLWLAGKMGKIVAYNEFDALTTYLLFLRMAFFGGHFSEDEYIHEQDRVREMIQEKGGHLLDYLKEWDRLQEAVGA